MKGEHMDYLMGIDLGSTSLKAVVFDLAGNIVAEASRPTRRCHPQADHPEWTVWMPDQIWGDTAAVIREAVGQLDDARKVRGVSVTGFGGDGMPLDEEGKWLYPAISWLDPRVEPQSRWWIENIGAEKQFSITGNHVYMYNTALRLRWMSENEPEILGRTWKWLLVVDFVNYMLSGVAATDCSLASTTLLLDQRKLEWSEELLRLSGIDRRLLCDLRRSGTPLGQVTQEAAKLTGLAEGTPVVQGGHDFLCGAMAAGAYEPGIMLDVTGTWELVVAATREPLLTGQVFQSGLMIETHVARGMYSVSGAAVASGMLEWFRNEFGQPEKLLAEQKGTGDWDYLIEAAAASPPGARGAMFLPHLSGSVCPIRDPRSLGVFAGLSDHTQRADLLRAIFEGLSYQFRQMKESMHAAGLGTDCKVVVIGGATRNSFWMQNKADVTGVAIEVSELPEATALGAAVMAGIGVGLYQDEREACERTYKPGRTFDPNPQLAGKYEHWYKIYKQLYPAMKEINSQLYSTRAGVESSDPR
jgi:xylulokinase